MIDRNKLMRGVILALAILFAAPFVGAAAPLVGVPEGTGGRVATVNRCSVGE